MTSKYANYYPHDEDDFDMDYKHDGDEGDQISDGQDEEKKDED